MEGLMEKIVSLAKRRGFVYQGSEIYGGLAGTWDYGPLGVELRKNIENSWWNKFVSERDDIYGVDAAILMNPKVWEASGHIVGFNDPLVEDSITHKRYRADHLLQENKIDSTGMSVDEMDKIIKEKAITSPDGNRLGSVKQFNMMFKTSIGSTSEDIVYLRPETAQGIFVNFKNIIDSFHPKLPFGIAQIGTAFRNEINARDFLFRVREFKMMEVEYFVNGNNWEENFEKWRGDMSLWLDEIGLSKNKVHELEVGEEGRAHYSSRTIDFEYDYPFGRKELCGLAYRTDYDLQQHIKMSKTKLEYLDDDTKEKIVPHVIEPSFGIGRLLLALLLDAYQEDEVGGEKRVFLKFKPSIAPVKVAVFPLLKNKPDLVEKAREVYEEIKKTIPQAMFDSNGNIGKRYRRQDEIGTPYCVTIDFDTLEDSTVTVRNRDTAEQERVKIDDLLSYMRM